MKKIQNNISSVISQLRNSRFANVFLLATIFIFCMFLYVDTTNYRLSGNDDDTFFKVSLDNYSVKDIFTKNVLLNNNIKTYYRPVLMISFLLDNTIAHSPTTLHFTNIILHFICCIILFIFLKRYFFDKAISFWAVMFFAVCPINIFTVAWIPGRNDSLLCVFFLLSLIFFMEYLKSDKKIFLVLNLLSLTAAIFTKENSAIIPVICLCFWFMCGKKFSKEFWLVFLSQFCIVAVFFVIYSHFVDITNLSDRINSLIANIKMLFDYYSGVYLCNIHFSKYVSDRNFVLGIIAFCMSIFFAGLCGLKTKDKIFYFVLPVLMILPTLMIGQMFFQGNRVYIPLVFMLIPFVSFLQRYLSKRNVYIVLILLVIFSSFITVKYKKVFYNELTYLGTIDKEKPNAEIYIANLYSYNLLKYARLQEASVKAYEIAEITDYRNPYNLYVLSIINMHRKNFVQAIKYLEQILYFDNDVYTKLAVCYEKIGDDKAAQYYYNIVLSLNNNSVEIANKLIEREKECLAGKAKVAY